MSPSETVGVVFLALLAIAIIIVGAVHSAKEVGCDCSKCDEQRMSGGK